MALSLFRRCWPWTLDSACSVCFVRHITDLQVEDLVAKSAANKELNDKKRAATSSANLARSR